MTTASADPKALALYQTRIIRGTLLGSLSRDMVVGSFLVAFAVQVLDFTETQLSWFLAMVPLAVVLRYPFLDVIRAKSRVQVTLWARIIQLFCLLALLLFPQSWLTLPVLICIATIFTFGNDFLQNAVWTNLVTEFTSSKDRGQFLGRLRTWKQSSALIFAFVGFMLVGDQLSRSEHRVMLLIVIVLCVNSIYWFSRIPANPPPESVRSHSGRGQFLATIRNAPLMRRPLLLTILVTSVQWPILLVYFYGTLNVPANLIMLDILMGMLGPIFSNWFWGKKADAQGHKRIYKTYFAYALFLYPIILLIPDFDAIPANGLQWYLGVGAMLTFSFFAGVLNAGRMMASTLYHAEFVNAPGGFHAFNLLTATMKIWTGALTAIGGLLLAFFTKEPVSNFVYGDAGLIWLDPFRLISLVLILTLIAFGFVFASGIPENVQNKATA